MGFDEDMDPDVWSPQEQQILEQQLPNAAYLDPLHKYVWLAYFFPNKLATDVARRCKWMDLMKEVSQVSNEAENWLATVPHELQKDDVMLRELFEEMDQIISHVTDNLRSGKLANQTADLFDRLQELIDHITNSTSAGFPPFPNT